MIVGTFVVSLIVGILMMIKGVKRNNDWICGWGVFLTIAGIAMTFVAWPIIYIESYMNLTKMEAFYDANRSAYETTVEYTKNAIYRISKDSALGIDVENLRQSTNWSERLAEFRDMIVDYNTCIYKLRRYNATPILSPLFANPRADLKLIILAE